MKKPKSLVAAKRWVIFNRKTGKYFIPPGEDFPEGWARKEVLKSCILKSCISLEGGEVLVEVNFSMSPTGKVWNCGD